MRTSILLAFVTGIALAAFGPRAAHAALPECSASTAQYTVCHVGTSVYTSCGDGTFIPGRVNDHHTVNMKCKTSGAPLGKKPTTKDKQQEQPPTADE